MVEISVRTRWWHEHAHELSITNKASVTFTGVSTIIVDTVCILDALETADITLVYI